MRFRVLDSKIIDGYNVASVYRFVLSAAHIHFISPELRSLEDCPELDTSYVPEDPEAPPPPPPDHSPLEGTVAGLLEALVIEDPSVEEMEEFCLHFISSLGTEAAPWIVKKIHDECGEQPVDDIAAFTWWVAAVRRTRSNLWVNSSIHHSISLYRHKTN